MNQNHNPIDAAVVVLAAGRGTRMKSDLPKVATELLGKPLLQHVLENLRAAGLRRFCIVVGYKREIVEALVPDWPDCKIEFAVQTEQLGTAHALACARPDLADFCGPLLVASGDMPALSPASFRALLDQHNQEGNSSTVLTAHLNDPTGYGRVVRDPGTHQVLRIVEHKDADAEMHRIQEVNTGTYVFTSPAIFEDLKAIGSQNAQNEYYLPDIIALHNQKQLHCGAMMLANATEAHGINSTEELERLAAVLQAS
ncbi:MAG: NTP transferase domain-containing protein [Leptospiraceae bacterium]|nr:NTP transferase domain-containing protein [Leptospiraceae bacterium]